MTGEQGLQENSDTKERLGKGGKAVPPERASDRRAVGEGRTRGKISKRG